MICEFLRSGIANWDDVFHELTEKFRAFGFLIHRDRWTAFANDVSQAQPSGNELWRNRAKEARVGSRLLADKKRSAFWCERISPPPIFLQKIETDERVHQNPQSAQRN